MMESTHFNREFWDLFDARCRPKIETACQYHLHRMHCNSVDLDDMVSWVHCRVWKMVEDRPNQILAEGLTVNQCVERIENASKMLARWSFLALVRKGTRHAERERASDIEMIERLAVTRSSTPQIEKSETTLAALDSLRSKLNAELRGKLAASWKDPSERERVALALDATRPEDDSLRESIAAGDVRINTIEKMRSRSLHRSRAIMKSLRKNIAVMLLSLSVSLLTTASAFATPSDDGGEQTGGRSAIVLE